MLKTVWPAWASRLPRQWWWWIGGAAVVVLLGLSAVLTPPPSAGAPTGVLAANQPPTPGLITDASLALSVLLKLGAVIVLIYGSLFLLRRWQTGALTARPRRVTVLESTRLSPRQALHVVQAGGRTLLIGATDQTLTVLTEIEGDGAPANFTAALTRALDPTPPAPEAVE